MKIQSNKPAPPEPLDSSYPGLPATENAVFLNFSALNLPFKSIPSGDVAVYYANDESSGDSADRSSEDSGSNVDEMDEALWLLGQPVSSLNMVHPLELLPAKQGSDTDRCNSDKANDNNQKLETADVNMHATGSQAVSIVDLPHVSNHDKSSLENPVHQLGDARGLLLNENNEKTASFQVKANELLVPINEKLEIPESKVANTLNRVLDVKNPTPGVAELLQKNQEMTADAQMVASIDMAFGKSISSSNGRTNRETQELETKYKINIELLTDKKEASGSVEKNISNINIKIQPPDNVGKILAKLTMEKNEVNLVILTENNHDKKIIESSLPQLREQFALSDINLNSVDIQTSLKGGHEQSRFNEYRQPDELESVNRFAVKAEIKNKNKKIKTLIDTYV